MPFELSRRYIFREIQDVIYSGRYRQYHVTFPIGKDFSVLIQEVGSSSLSKKVHFSEFLEKLATQFLI